MRIADGPTRTLPSSPPPRPTTIKPASGRVVVDSFERARTSFLPRPTVPAMPPNTLSAMRPPIGLVAGGAPPATFTSPGPSIPPGTTATMGPNATPQQAAAYVLQFEVGVDQGTQANVFVQAVEPHADDGDWLQSFYGALGTENSARLVSNAVHYESYLDWPPDTAQAHVETVQESLATLYQAGALNQGDMDALVHQWATDSRQMAPGFNPGLALAFGDLPYESEGLQNLFVGSAVQLSTSDTLPDQTANEVAAAGAWVLSQTSSDNQMLVLHQVQEQGQLPAFLDRAMRGPTTVPTILNLTQGAYDPMTGTWNHPIETSYDGVARLVFNLSYAGVRDSFQGPSPLSAAELNSLQTDVFAETVKALGDERERAWAGNTFLKDGLARIFMDDYDAIMGAVLSENRATFRLPDRDALLHGMQGLFQNALFTPPLGNESQRLVDFMSDRLGTMAADIRGTDVGGLTDEQIAAKYGPGIDRYRLTHMAGLLTGCLMSGLQQAEGVIEANAAAGANALELVLDLGLSLVPGASTLSGLGDAALGKIVDGLTDEALGAIQDMTVEEARKYLAARGMAGLDSRAALDELKRLAEGQVHLYGDWAEALESGLGEN